MNSSFCLCIYICIITILGLFLNDLSRLVGAEGRVIATEISSSFLQHLQRRVASEGLSNVTLCRTESTDTVFQGVPDGSVDIAFICDVYHHFEFPKTTMRGPVFIA